MNSAIDTMMKEHDLILRFNKIIQRACLNILEGHDVCIDDFKNMIRFARNYADKHHHGKEEKILFKEMIKHLGTIGTKLITNGMLVEHDLGRLYISELESALNKYTSDPKAEVKLDIITNAFAYTLHLKRHIDKENEVIFTYANNTLLKEILDDINIKTDEFENQANENNIQKEYYELLLMLENKYNI